MIVKSPSSPSSFLRRQESLSPKTKHSQVEKEIIIIRAGITIDGSGDKK